MSELFRFPTTTRREPAIDGWLHQQVPDLGVIAHEWFGQMRACGDDVREVMNDEHPVACVEDAAFAYVNVFRAHVNVGFFFGAELNDPSHLLEGSGRRMRHVKVRPGASLDVAALRALIGDAYEDMKTRLDLEAKEPT
jgi:hypothetical protein